MRNLGRLPSGAWRQRIPVALAAMIIFLATAVPALAAGPIQDDGNMFSSGARSSAETKSNQIQRDTGKSVTVKTVANLGGKEISATADQFFQQQKLNGVLIYAARDDKKLAVKVGTDTRSAISTGEEGAIRDQMTQRFAANDFDGGLLTAIDRIGTDLRAAAPARTGNQPATAPAAKKGSGVPVFLIVLLVLVGVGVVLFFLLRRRSTPSAPSGGYGAGPVQGGYGPGYGPGYGQPSGGGGNVAGSILGGAAAGIGGAIVGNAIYDHFRDDDDDNRNRDAGDRASVGDYGSSGDDRGAVSDSGQDVGSWGDSGDSSVGDWGSVGDSGGGGDPGGD